MKTLLIDGNNLLYRTFWAAKYKAKQTSDLKDNHNDIYIYLRSLKSYVDKFKPVNVFCVWDKRLAYPFGNFRKELCTTEYKGNRNNAKFEEVFDKLDEIIKAVESLGIKNFYPFRMEADDVISWLSSNIEGEKIIVSTDKDMLQLINSDIKVYNPNTKKIIDLNNFEETTQLKCPKDYFFYRCFTGDKSDNIPGIPKVGLKTYLKLTKDWDYNLDNIDLPESQKNIILTNISLMDLHYGYTYYNEEVPTYKAQLFQNKGLYNESKFNKDKFMQICRDKNFYSILSGIEQWQNSFGDNDTFIDSTEEIRNKYINE